MQLRKIGSFFVGGRTVTLDGLPVEQRRLAIGAAPRPVDPNGDHVTGQMYVQEFRLAEPRCPYPVLFWHGGGMTGVNWETTPDGRPGWLTRFLEAGFDVLVSDAVERGRSSWSMYPQIYEGAPLFRTKNEAWDMFRMGPPGSYATDAAARRPWPEVQFPPEAFDAFAAQWVPRWVGHEAMTEAAYGALLARVGPCLVVGHSQGGGFALQMTQRYPDLVRAVVALEPSGAPETAGISDALPPHLVLWGDHIADHPVWTRYRGAVDAYVSALAAHGVPARILDLPQEGTAGNTHFLMMDRNSDALAGRVIDWLAAAAEAAAR
ncbi:alpha/beta hydrolase family protein [Azorhizobium sp. AG788]|uniref:alpha/beta fold hydrolase n=1 Tax=Azorhizobium sp. AG788 TaxID=2183897 RepID=UPI0010616EF7|nr:alpha/beta fold hydrolase [Azorhizobium sp. AG788]TDT92608.1 alpha/beta hydrolase family protein [Azorhizobium sp. AG788]